MIFADGKIWAFVLSSMQTWKKIGIKNKIKYHKMNDSQTIIETV